MKIRMLTLYSSPEGTLKPDDVVDLPAKIAKELIAARAAVEVKNDPAAAADAKAEGGSNRRGSRGRGRGKGTDDDETGGDSEPDGDADGEPEA